MSRSAVVLGARRTGGAVVDRLLADGWQVTAVARSAGTLQAIRDRGARAVGADATDPAELGAVLDEASAAQGGLDLVVNALAGRIPPGPFGGGPVADTDLATFRAWGVAVAEQTFTFLNAGAAALRGAAGPAGPESTRPGPAGPGPATPDRLHGGTLIQLTGGSSLRAAAGRGPWAAGAFATRALTHAAALELAPEGIHVALLIVDGTIASEVELPELAAAVAYLAAPGELRRAHELHLGHAATAWQPY
jgi:NAD(P)-dependent dehydrogenase (short-subunit alcohol dehydrogenase family)